MKTTGVGIPYLKTLESSGGEDQHNLCCYQSLLSFDPHWRNTWAPRIIVILSIFSRANTRKKPHDRCMLDIPKACIVLSQSDFKILYRLVIV
jgi:hypothetical protein